MTRQTNFSMVNDGCNMTDEPQIEIRPVILDDDAAAMLFVCETKKLRDEFLRHAEKKLSIFKNKQKLDFDEKQELFLDILSSEALLDSEMFIYSYHFFGDDDDDVYTLMMDQKLFAVKYDEKIPVVEIILVQIENGENDSLFDMWSDDDESKQ